MVVTANPMSGQQVTYAYKSSPSSVLYANPACFCKVLYSGEPSRGPWSLYMTSRARSGIGDVGQLVILSGPGCSQP